MQVSYIEFSPDEKYLLSYSSREPTNPQEKAAMVVNVFDTQSGAKLRKFEGSVEEFAVGSAAMGDGSLKWPIFKWAASGCAPLPHPIHPDPSYLPSWSTCHAVGCAVKGGGSFKWPIFKWAVRHTASALPFPALLRPLSSFLWCKSTSLASQRCGNHTCHLKKRLACPGDS